MQTTFPRLMMQHAAQRPAAPALREKEYGIWQTWSWARAAEDVKLMSCGLAALGFEPGQNLAIVGDNRPHLYMAFIAAQSLRGVPVPMYQDAIASEMAFVLQDAEIQFAFAENQEQVDKLLELRESVPGLLKHIIYDDPRGLRNYSHEGLISIERLFEFGRQYAQQHPQFYEQSVAQGQPGDVSVILYTSGTTGRPKGVCQTHESFIRAAQGGVEVDGLVPEDNIISYLPPAWVGDHLFSIAQWLLSLIHI